MEPITNSQTYPKVVSPGSKHIHNWFVTVFSSLVASVGSRLFPRVVGPRLRLVRADLMISRLLRSGSISSYPAGLLPWVAVLSGTWTKQERSNEVFLLLFCILHLHVLGLLRSLLSMDSVSTGLHIENVGPGERNLCWALKDGVLFIGHWSWSHANTGQMWHIVTHRFCKFCTLFVAEGQHFSRPRWRCHVSGSPDLSDNLHCLAPNCTVHLFWFIERNISNVVCNSDICNLHLYNIYMYLYKSYLSHILTWSARFLRCSFLHGQPRLTDHALSWSSIACRPNLKSHNWGGLEVQICCERISWALVAVKNRLAEATRVTQVAKVVHEFRCSFQYFQSAMAGLVSQFLYRAPPFHQGLHSPRLGSWSWNLRWHPSWTLICSYSMSFHADGSDFWACARDNWLVDKMSFPFLSIDTFPFLPFLAHVCSACARFSI